MKRNNKSFEDGKRMVAELKSSFFKNLYHWTTTLDFVNFLHFLHFLSCPR
jgi:hypothetical protein